ncbi:hypothetical protein [Fundidesulfovibrio soli]|uniref:hypothetical protein n=1 Tax=Fundidesulfovibrio soli TaxID=2922716 RepID=UPI001FAEC944|nr:hypothetical protein [Fundidesulfovibrio soli]
MRFTERAKKDLRAIAWMVGFLLVFLLSGAGYLYFNLCSDDAFSTTLSPSGKYKATVTVRNCGATTSHNYLVSIGESGDTYFLEKAGWLYGARRNAKGDWGVSVVWLSDNEVSVRYFDCHSLKLEDNGPVVAGQRIAVSFDQALDAP